MKCIERYDEYKKDDFDSIIIKIRNGTIKCGKYSHLVKINDKEMKGKEFFNNGKSKNSKS